MNAAALGDSGRLPLGNAFRRFGFGVKQRCSMAPRSVTKHARAVRGRNDLMVEYADRKFLLSHETGLAQMMRTPWR